MQLSKQKIDQKTQTQIHNFFYQAIADIRSPHEAEAFSKDILTPAELEALSKRMAVAIYLQKGYSYKKIKKSIRVSSATVATIAEQLKKGEGFKIALKKIQAEEWADHWSKKISKMVRGK